LEREFVETYKTGRLTEPIDIILPTHGKLEELTVPCVQALYAHTRNLFHLIVVDDSTPDMNGGKDQTPQWFKTMQIEHGNITYIHSDTPFKSGNQIFNLGLQYGNARFVATVMNSVRVEPDWDVVAVQMMANKPKVGIIGLKCLKLGWDNKRIEGDNVKTDGLIESAGVCMNDYTPCDMGRNEPSHRLSVSYPCFSLQWAFALLRREAVVGNLDEDMWESFVGWDDIDNTLYLRYKGWEAWYCGLGVGYHLTHATRGSTSDEALIKNRKNAEIFYKRWGYWDKFRQRNPYAPEYFPNGNVKFLCNADELPLNVTDETTNFGSIILNKSLWVAEENALTTLATKVAKQSAVLVEVGSWFGNSTCLLANVVKASGGHLHCVDHWKGSEGTLTRQEATEQDIYGLFVENMRGLGLWEYITPMVIDSKTACETFKDNSIDFLFLDGDHRYQQFKEDLTIWIPKMKTGGIICGHDCDAYYSKVSPELKEHLDKHLDIDFTGVHHAGVMKGLFEVFNDDYSIVDDTRIWFKEI